MKKNSTYPLVTVGVPTQNSKGQIENAVKSVLRQDYPAIEIIISDDCSTDNTEEVCTRLSQQYPTVRYVRQPHDIGLVNNFDYVLNHASGKYYMWLADDDTLEPGIISKYVAFLTSHQDYSLVSGQVLYWAGDRPVFYEKDFNMEQDSPKLRVINYYFKVVHGAIYYGMMHADTARRIPQRARIGDDWHFVASLAYLGKIKNLDCVGYNKGLGGTSRTFKNYAEVIGASKFSAVFPRFTIAAHAFVEILFRKNIYSSTPFYQRLPLAFSSGLSVLVSYYSKEFPFIVGGHVKRLVNHISRSGLKAYRVFKSLTLRAVHEIRVFFF